MIISRMKAGWLMIGGSIFLFMIIGILPESQIALAGLLNLLFLLSIGFMIIGTYFVRTSKPCRMCGEQVHRPDPTCRYCGYVFKDSASAQGK